MAECWEEAPISTLLYDRRAVGDSFAGHRILTSYLQRLPIRQRGFRALLPLFPRAAEHLPVADARLVLSSSSAFAQGVRTAPGSTHVCYSHSPFRYVWHERDRAVGEFPPVLRPLGRRLLDRIRRWDLAASTRVDHYLANSRLTQERIAEFYGRESTVVHPPVDVDRFSVADDHDDYFLVVCELVRHKNVDVALGAAERAGVPIKVVGEGPEREELGRRFPAAEFLGRLADADLARVYERARAFVMPAVEEFGIVAVEAHAAGRPVLAAAAGGALEIVVPGQTGVLVPPRDLAAAAAAMHDVDWDGFDSATIRARAEEFSTPVFKRRLVEQVSGFLSAAPAGAV